MRRRWQEVLFNKTRHVFGTKMNNPWPVSNRLAETMSLSTYVKNRLPEKHVSCELLENISEQHLGQGAESVTY